MRERSLAGLLCLDKNTPVSGCTVCRWSHLEVLQCQLQTDVFAAGIPATSFQITKRKTSKSLGLLLLFVPPRFVTGKSNPVLSLAAQLLSLCYHGTCDKLQAAHRQQHKLPCRVAVCSPKCRNSAQPELPGKQLGAGHLRQEILQVS